MSNLYEIAHAEAHVMNYEHDCQTLAEEQFMRDFLVWIHEPKLNHTDDPNDPHDVY